MAAQFLVLVQVVEEEAAAGGPQFVDHSRVLVEFGVLVQSEEVIGVLGVQLVVVSGEEVQVFSPAEEESVAEYIPLVGREVGLELVD